MGTLNYFELTMEVKNTQAANKKLYNKDAPILNVSSKSIDAKVKETQENLKTQDSEDNSVISKNTTNLPCGLPNFGNTCYLNAVVQLLGSMESFKEAMSMENLYSVAEKYGSVKARQVKSYGAKQSFPCFYHTREILNYLKENFNTKCPIDQRTEKKLQVLVNGLREKVDKEEYCNTEQHDSMEFLKKTYGSLIK